MATNDSPLSIAASRGLSLAAGVVSPNAWLSHNQASRAPAPLLRFTDLISGPATGLGDGLGSGVIVTIWAQGVGDSQGTGKVYFTDFNGTKREAAHVYYWKRADGELPSGPARLWYSHLMQEIAFSIPAGSVDGLGSITIEKDAQTSNALPFTVRAGSIYHVKSTGNNANNGSFASPWASWSGGPSSQAEAGATTYFHDVDTGDAEAPQERAIYWNNAAASSTESAQFAVAAYPGHQPKAIAQKAVEGYLTAGMVLSKFDCYASNWLSVDANGQPTGTQLTGNGGSYCIQTSKDGRVVCNRTTDIPGACVDSQAGAIVGTQQYDDYSSNCKMFGNEIFDYGCFGTSKFHHTTYMTQRKQDGTDPQTPAWEWGWNFLHGNNAKQGIHNYDEGLNKGDLTTPLNIHDNVIVDQAGSGISIGSTSGWSMPVNITNNVIVRSGRAAAWDGIDPATADGAENGGISIRDGSTYGLLSTVTLENNLVFGHTIDQPTNDAGAVMLQGDADNVTIVMNKNVLIDEVNLEYIGTSFNADNKRDNISGSQNTYWSLAASPTHSAPTFDTAPITTDPLISRDGAIIIVGASSPLIGAGDATGFDIYGVPRSTNQTAGPVECLE